MKGEPRYRSRLLCLSLLALPAAVLGCAGGGRDRMPPASVPAAEAEDEGRIKFICNTTYDGRGF